MFRAFLLPLLLFIFSHVDAKIFSVGPGQTYISPNALYNANVIGHGDTIEIEGSDYVGNAVLAVWRMNNLFIKGIDGRPHLKANGKYIIGKGIWVFAGNNITVENIEFSGAKVPDKNGAGIRLDGVGMTVKNCFFHDNENGILTSSPYQGTILIEYTEFANNGFGDGFSHNLYINHADTLIFRHNYSHHAFIGHCLKTRATHNFIEYNRIMDEETGRSSRLIDISNGGLCFIIGNVFMQGERAENRNLIGYGLEGLSNPTAHELIIVSNTFVNKRFSGDFINMHGLTDFANVSNNIFAGNGTLVSQTPDVFEGNLARQNIDAVKFVDESIYNYQLMSNSPAIDLAVEQSNFNGLSLTPIYEYKHHGI